MWLCDRDVTIACNGAGGRVGFEINAFRAGPLMRAVIPLKLVSQKNACHSRMAAECYSWTACNKMHRLILIFTMMVMQSGCRLFEKQTESIDLEDHVPNTHPEIESRELDVRESLIRYKSSGFSEGTIAYIAFGINETWVKPPPRFIDRFTELEIDIRSIENAKFTSTGLCLDSRENAKIYLVEIDHWRDDNSVAVRFEENPHLIEGGPNSGLSRDLLHIIEFSAGNWTFKRIERK